MSDDGEVGAGWLVGRAAPLFPVAQGTERDVIARGKLLLRNRPPTTVRNPVR